MYHYQIQRDERLEFAKREIEYEERVERKRIADEDRRRREAENARRAAAAEEIRRKQELEAAKKARLLEEERLWYDLKFDFVVYILRPSKFSYLIPTLMIIFPTCLC